MPVTDVFTSRHSVFQRAVIAEYQCNHQPAFGIADLFQGLADGFAKTG